MLGDAFLDGCFGHEVFFNESEAEISKDQELWGLVLVNSIRSLWFNPRLKNEGDLKRAENEAQKTRHWLRSKDFKWICEEVFAFRDAGALADKIIASVGKIRRPTLEKWLSQVQQGDTALRTQEQKKRRKHGHTSP